MPLLDLHDEFEHAVSLVLWDEAWEEHADELARIRAEVTAEHGHFQSTAGRMFLGSKFLERASIFLEQYGIYPPTPRHSIRYGEDTKRAAEMRARCKQCAAQHAKNLAVRSRIADLLKLRSLAWGRYLPFDNFNERTSAYHRWTLLSPTLGRPPERWRRASAAPTAEAHHGEDGLAEFTAALLRPYCASAPRLDIPADMGAATIAACAIFVPGSHWAWMSSRSSAHITPLKGDIAGIARAWAPAEPPSPSGRPGCHADARLVSSPPDVRPMH